MSEPLIDVTGVRLRRRREARRRRLKRLGVLAAVVAVLGGLGWLVLASPVLAVATVEVQGTKLLATEEVAGAAAVPLGVPLARLDEAAIVQRVAELPAVAGARLERRWPTTVRLVVTEREVRLVLARDGGYDWVDSTGVVFHHSPARPPGTVLAKAADDDPELLARIVAVVNALPVQVRDLAATVTADTLDSITVQLADGRAVVWGSAEASDLKAQVVVPLLAVKAKVYDVSSPSHPTTR